MSVSTTIHSPQIPAALVALLVALCCGTSLVHAAAAASTVRAAVDKTAHNSNRRTHVDDAAAISSPAQVSYIASRRFPMEGDHNVTLCTAPPLSSGPGAAASVHEVGVSLRFPTRGHGFALAAPTGNGTPGCFQVATGVAANAGPGNLSISGSVAGTGSQAVEIEYYESVAVAFGLRPYINEAVGTLLLAPDPEIIAAAVMPGATGAKVSMDLPFATPPRTEHWSATTPSAGKLLSEPEQVLSFSLAGFPATVNQDVKITILLPSGNTIVKWRRLMRAPPLPDGSSVLPVQATSLSLSLSLSLSVCVCACVCYTYIVPSRSTTPPSRC